MNIRAIVVDDTIFYRKIISDILASLPNVTVVGTANNGEVALSRIRSLKPDLVTLDIEMPGMNGLTVLQKVQDEGLETGFLMVSSKTTKGAEITFAALELGAFDFLEKPNEDSFGDSTKKIKQDLIGKVRAFIGSMEMKKIFKGKERQKKERPQIAKRAEAASILSRTKRTEKSHIVAIGASTGGPKALSTLLSQFPASVGVPVFIVQHLPPAFSTSLAKNLDSRCPLNVRIATDGEEIEKDIVYLGPGGSQMKVASAGGGRKIVRLTDDPPENNCKPSVDFLFRSVAREYGSRATCVVMTGMGTDGKLGVRVAKSTGSLSITQSQESCIVYGMPKAVVEAGLSDIIAPLDTLHVEILNSLTK